MMIYPNPLNPQRYVLLVPEIMGKCDALAVGHVTIEMCYQGDWLVVKPGFHWPDKWYADQVVGGYFDSAWKVAAPPPTPAK